MVVYLSFIFLKVSFYLFDCFKRLLLILIIMSFRFYTCTNNTKVSIEKLVCSVLFYSIQLFKKYVCCI